MGFYTLFARGIDIMTNSIFADALLVSPVSLCSASNYQEHMEEMHTFMDGELTSNSDILKLIGYNNLELMYANHGYHVRFMNNIFHINAYDLLVTNFVWMYRSYHLRGFSYDYFILEFFAWQKANKLFLKKEAAAEINQVYQWMIDHHQGFISLAESPDYKRLPFVTNMQEIGFYFLEGMLYNDNKLCMELIGSYVQKADVLSDLYVEVISPCLYEIGRLWEEGEISAAQEHLATAIVIRIMSVMYGSFVLPGKEKGKAVMMTAPGEAHEIGARMTADLLEMDGWQVECLFSQSRLNDILNFLREFKPCILGIAIVMPFNIEVVRRLIVEMKKDCNLASIKVMVGGQAFASSPQVWQKIGADGYCVDSREAVKLACKWWERRNIDEFN